MGSTDPGTWRRLIVVPFRATIPTQGSRSNYGDILVQEAGPSILAWAVEGAVNFARNGYQLQTPDVVEETTEAYRGQEDWVGNFLSECCTLEPGAWIPASNLYRRYREWAEGAGDYVRRLPDFNTALENRGLAKKRTKTCNVWQGVGMQ
ncbi:primase-like DNA-binding domain-containing protein [Flavonifractor sp. An112]|uniref:primase-like DNA-binding domain-containing protein n=1 Tax=Flavonifractor sp. An112 TaxID=1965544 RepID=UPI00130283A3|nr:primase-like DNA-binding domain-containing protein [Flavonifractor sp. An112]